MGKRLQQQRNPFSLGAQHQQEKHQDSHLRSQPPKQGSTTPARPGLSVAPVASKSLMSPIAPPTAAATTSIAETPANTAQIQSYPARLAAEPQSLAPTTVTTLRQPDNAAVALSTAQKEDEPGAPAYNLEGSGLLVMASASKRREQVKVSRASRRSEQREQRLTFLPDSDRGRRLTFSSNGSSPHEKMSVSAATVARPVVYNAQELPPSPPPTKPQRTQRYADVLGPESSIRPALGMPMLWKAVSGTDSSPSRIGKPIPLLLPPPQPPLPQISVQDQPQRQEQQQQEQQHGWLIDRPGHYWLDDQDIKTVRDLIDTNAQEWRLALQRWYTDKDESKGITDCRRRKVVLEQRLEGQVKGIMHDMFLCRREHL